MQQNFFQRNKNLVIVLVLVLLFVLWGFSKYNNFVSINERVNGQWAQIENQLQRRFDLVPNLVGTVKGVTSQEQKVFGDIADARTRYAGSTNINDKALAAGQFESALGRLLVITENYPSLQSSQAFKDLMVQLEGTENRISVERKGYNDLVKEYNTNVKVFPSAIFAKIFGFTEKNYFEVADEAKENPKVDFVN